MSTAKIDVNVIGASAIQKHRVASGATRFYRGEPVSNEDLTYASGVADVNTISQAVDGTPLIIAQTDGDDDAFVGIAAQNAPIGNDTTVDAEWVDVVEPIAQFTRLRAKAKDTTICDTLTELVGLLFDICTFDLDGTSEIFTIQPAGVDTGGLSIRYGLWEKGMLDVVVDARAMRVDIT